MTALDDKAPKSSQTPTNNEESVASLKRLLNSALSYHVDAVSDLTVSTRFHIQKAGATVWAKMTKPASGVIQVIRDANSDKGTPLRKVIADVRLTASDKINRVKVARFNFFLNESCYGRRFRRKVKNPFPMHYFL
jgi:hypothetical protein